MTLQVPLEQFATTLARLGLPHEAYVCTQEGATRVTACHPAHQVLVTTCTRQEPAVARQILTDAGLVVYDGVWSTESTVTLQEAEPEMFVAAVAYRSGEDRPGLWIDAYASLPSHMQVLRCLYEEFRRTGELGEIHFEEFTRLANANVIIVNPSELRSFVDKNHALLTSTNQTEDTGTP